MKTIKILSIILLSGLLFITSCKDDDSGPQGPGIDLVNCDDSNCNEKSCALSIPIVTDIACTIDNASDIYWYVVEVSQENVDNNGGVYSFNFINHSEDMTFKVNLFSEGATAGNVSVTGNGDLEYEPFDDVTGGIQFFIPGSYYISVQSLNSQAGIGTYEILMN